MEDFEIRFSGSGGQGLQLSAKILSQALNREAKQVSFSQSYEPTSRGGFSRADLVVSDGIADYPLVSSLDYLVVLDQSAFEMSLKLLREDTQVIIDARKVPNPPKGEFKLIELPLSETALNLGNARVANIVTLGALVGISGVCRYENLLEAIRSGVPKKFLDLNLEAVAEGYKMTAPVNSPELVAAS